MKTILLFSASILAAWTLHAANPGVITIGGTTPGSNNTNPPSVITPGSPNQVYRTNYVVVDGNGRVVDQNFWPSNSASMKETLENIGIRAATADKLNNLPGAAYLPQNLSPVIQTNIGNTYGTYEAFPSIAASPDKSTIYMVWRASSHHGVKSNSMLLLAETRNQGQSWSSPSVVVNGGNADVRNQTFGVLKSGRLILTYWPYNFLNTNGENLKWEPGICTISDDEGDTWHDIGTIPTNGVIEPRRISGAANGVTVESCGRLYSGYYSMKADGSQTEAYCATSDDIGTNWSTHLITAQDSKSNGEVEPIILPVNSNNVAAFVRSGNGLEVYWSTNRAENWTKRGVLPISVIGIVTPPGVVLIQGPDGPEIELIIGQRNNSRPIAILRAPAAAIYNNPGILTNRIYWPLGGNHVIAGTSLIDDGGYCSAVSLDNNGEALCAYYYAPDDTLTNAEIRLFRADMPKTVAGNFAVGLTNFAREYRTGTVSPTGQTPNYDGGYFFGTYNSTAFGLGMFQSGSQYWVETRFNGIGDANRGWRVYDVNMARYPFRVDSTGDSFLLGRAYLTNGIALKTNSAPENVSIGTTPPDKWFPMVDITTGVTNWVPAWVAH